MKNKYFNLEDFFSKYKDKKFIFIKGERRAGRKWFYERLKEKQKSKER